MAGRRFRDFGRYPKPALAPLPNPAMQSLHDEAAAGTNAIDAAGSVDEEGAGPPPDAQVVVHSTATASKSRSKTAGTWKAAELREKQSRFARVTMMLQESMTRERREKIRRKRRAMQLAGLRTVRGQSPTRGADQVEEQGQGGGDGKRGPEGAGATEAGDKSKGATLPHTITFSLPSRAGSGQARDSASSSANAPQARRRRRGPRSTHAASRLAQTWAAPGGRETTDRETEDAQLVLDAGVVFGVCGQVDRPSDIAAVRLTDLDLVDARPEELAQFDQLQRVEAAENRLKPQHFSHLPKLRELELQSNHLRTVEPPLLGVFLRLEVLSLAHNRLRAGCLCALAALPRLKSLDLSHNRIKSFPLPLRPTASVAEQALAAAPASGNTSTDLHADTSVDAASTAAAYASISGNSKKGDGRAENAQEKPAQKEEEAATTAQREGPSGASSSRAEAGKSAVADTITGTEVKTTTTTTKGTTAPATAEAAEESRSTAATAGEANTAATAANTAAVTAATAAATAATAAATTRTKTITVDRVPFPELQTLILSQNPLSDGKVFAGCAGLPLLRYLALDHTKIRAIPTLLPEGWDRDVASDLATVLPFPSLRLLSMDCTRVKRSRDVIKCESWPALEELHIADTPFARKHASLPEDVGTALCARKGIEIMTKAQEPEKPPLDFAAQPLTKVNAKLPEIRVAQPALAAAAPPPVVPRTPRLPPVDAALGGDAEEASTARGSAVRSKRLPAPQRSKPTQQQKQQEGQGRGKVSSSPLSSRVPKSAPPAVSVSEYGSAGKAAGVEHGEGRGETIAEGGEGQKSNDDGGVEEEDHTGVFLTALAGVYGDEEEEEEEEEDEKEEGESESEEQTVEESVEQGKPLEQHQQQQQQTGKRLAAATLKRGEIRVPFTPFHGKQQSLRQYQRRLNRPRPSQGSRAVAEAKKLAGGRCGGGDGGSNRTQRQQDRSHAEVLHYLSQLKREEARVVEGDCLPTRVPVDILKYRGYEELFLEEDDVDVAEEDGDLKTQWEESAPSGIRLTVKALQYALDHPLKPTLDAGKRAKAASKHRLTQKPQGRKRKKPNHGIAALLRDTSGTTSALMASGASTGKRLLPDSPAANTTSRDSSNGGAPLALMPPPPPPSAHRQAPSHMRRWRAQSSSRRGASAAAGRGAGEAAGVSGSSPSSAVGAPETPQHLERSQRRLAYLEQLLLDLSITEDEDVVSHLREDDAGENERQAMLGEGNVGMSSAAAERRAVSDHSPHAQQSPTPLRTTQQQQQQQQRHESRPLAA